MLLAIILTPFISGIAAFLIRATGARRALLVGGALVHFALVAAAWVVRPAPAVGGWLALDEAGLLFLSITTLLFTAAAVYAISFLKRSERGHSHSSLIIHHSSLNEEADDELFTNAPEAVLIGCLFFFLGTMSVVCASQHLGLLWVAVEATTLASAPLIYFHRHARSLEAAWKYLLICSIGIALALLGNFLIAVATLGTGGHEMPLHMNALIASAKLFSQPWLKAAFIFLLVGYGTKMGLAPLHTWLPDAHSESPSMVSALLSGALLNCAFLGILRARQILCAAGLGEFTNGLLIGLGLLSMAFAAVFILAQADYKRLLAYSSVEHMGILAIGVGVGGIGTFGALFHAVNHSLTKAMLFLVAGNILALYQTKSVTAVRGLSRRLPVTAALWLAGFFAITGAPPFGTFTSELTILRGAFAQGNMLVGIAYLALLGLIFVAMATVVLRMAQGTSEHNESAPEPWLSIVPPAVLGALVLMLGVYLPKALADVLNGAARLIGGM
ncbi:NADH dehydrogenase FAD-containing subunit [bacterium]|nr:NADH dehydrogenase FAD-containing subunit [bacterium]